jgi:GrpB-like predicted nucleotidyltransferase (UPF0157 family)
VREIEHIGNSAVPGLALYAAIIDLQAGVVSLRSMPSLTHILAAAGYRDFGEAGAPGPQCFHRRQTACRCEPQHREGRSART